MKIILGTVTHNAEGNRKMNAPTLKFHWTALLTATCFLAVSLIGVAPAAQAQAPAQATYASPDEALQALVTAAEGQGSLRAGDDLRAGPRAVALRRRS